jgi:PAS domain S-box-containing protein
MQVNVWESATPSLLFQHIDAIVLTLDCDGMFTSLNPAAERCFACAVEELLGRPFTTVLDPFSVEKANLMIARTLSQGGLTDWELDHVQPDGPPILVGYTTATLRDQGGMVVGVGAIGHDLSAKLELTAQLAQTNQQLEGALLQLENSHAALKATQALLVQSEKMRALGQMVAGVAHEINNPAAFVAGNLAQLAQLTPALRALFDAYLPLKALAPADGRAVIEAAEAAVDIDYLWQDLPDLVRESQDGITRIGDIVRSLRNFSRLDEAELKAADINAGLRSTLQIIRPLSPPGIVITEAFGVLPAVLCRPGELNQVFLNLLTNAMQAIDRAGQIDVRSAHEQNRITVTIHDSGRGMDAATLARLGEPFFTTKPVGAGTGLGLAVSFGIVERHGGRLRFESAPGYGTSAIVEIPLKQA